MMGLEDVLDNIRKHKEEMIAEIVKKADLETARITQEAKAEASMALKESRDKAKADAAQIMTREISRANIEGRMLLNNAINEKVDAAISGILEDMDSYRKSGSYRSMLVKLSKKAMSELGSNCAIYCSGDDYDYLKGQLQKATIKRAVSNMSGGIIAVSEDGKREVDYSIKNIIDGMKDSIASEILKRMEGLNE